MGYVILIAAGCLLGQSEPANAERTREIETWRGSLNAIAKEHRIVAAGRPASPLKLVEDPVYAWNQPIRYGQIGSVYLWIQEDGRPGAIAAVFCWRRTQEHWAIMREFHSLAQTPLNATFRGQDVWTPTEPGLDWKPLPGDARVATSGKRQASQIRQLSRQFRAYTRTPKGQQWQLRLLPRPLYEYAIESGGTVRAGAVLALCQDMDPEIILVVEARPAAGMLAWHFACGSFTDYEAHLSLQDQEVWSAPTTLGDDAMSPDRVYWRGFITREATGPSSPNPPAEPDHKADGASD